MHWLETRRVYSYMDYESGKCIYVKKKQGEVIQNRRTRHKIYNRVKEGQVFKFVISELRLCAMDASSKRK